MANPLLSKGLSALNAFAGSELAERYGLHEPAKRWVAKGAKLGAELLTKQAARAKAARGSEEMEPSLLFDLTPTESQELIQKTMRRFADEVIRPAAAHADDALVPSAEVLEMAADLGLVALAIPESYDGLAEERSPVTWALAAEELSRGDMATALALLSPVSAAHTILDHGTEAQRRTWLPQMAGETFFPASTALLEAGPMFDPQKLKTQARARHGGFTLRGQKALVPLGRSARFFVVSAQVRGEGPRLFVVERDRPGLTVRSEPCMGLRGADSP